MNVSPIIADPVAPNCALVRVSPIIVDPVGGTSPIVLPYPNGVILYPAPTYDRTGPGAPLGSPLYPSSDLPATLLILNTDGTNYDTFTLTGDYEYSGTLSDGLNAELDFGDWHIYTEAYGDEYNTDALYDTGSFSIQDDFPSLLYINGAPCSRTAVGSGFYSGSGIGLYYDADRDTNAGSYKWTVAGSLSGVKIGSQNTPVGNYTNGITVS